jgi:site-specific DNA recombinase
VSARASRDGGGGYGASGFSVVQRPQAARYAPSAPVDPFDGLRVAWCGRTSTDDMQDPTLSLPRQLENSRTALPSGALIVAHFYDVESGRKDLEDRGHGTAHEQFRIPIPRDGGIQDLLEESARPDRRFDAVICESIDRISRRTFYGTKIEHELEQAGVALLAADEPLTLNGKRATAVLTRRVKQGIAEWYALQMLEQSWDGLCTHTRQGWNIGHPPYGYLADRVPHPVPARAAEGKTKTRLVPDPIRGPVVTQIYEWRLIDKLGYGDIADRLNTDHDLFPPPQALNPKLRDRKAWSRTGVREILTNPKYTGHMVFNRRATKSGRGKVNPPRLWVWSEHPTHEPLVTRDTYEAVQAMSRTRERSRRTAAPNKCPQTRRTYALRSYVYCTLCGRRMWGQTEQRRRPACVYFACQPDRNHKGREDRFPDHPTVVRVRQDLLLEAVHDFFARRIFGEQRRPLLETDLPRTDERAAQEWESRRKAITTRLEEIGRRQSRLLDQAEEASSGSRNADGFDEEFSRRLRDRFAALESERRTKLAELDELEADPPGRNHQTELLDRLPRFRARIAELPEDLQRELYDVFGLEVHYSQVDKSAVIRITLSEETIDSVVAAIEQVTMTVKTDREAGPRKNQAGGVAEGLGRAPCRIRTCAHGSGGRCSIP